MALRLFGRVASARMLARALHEQPAALRAAEKPIGTVSVASTAASAVQLSTTLPEILNAVEVFATSKVMHHTQNVAYSYKSAA